MNVGEGVEVVLPEARLSCLAEGFVSGDWGSGGNYEHNINLACYLSLLVFGTLNAYRFSVSKLRTKSDFGSIFAFRK